MVSCKGGRVRQGPGGWVGKVTAASEYSGGTVDRIVWRNAAGRFPWFIEDEHTTHLMMVMLELPVLVELAKEE